MSKRMTRKEVSKTSQNGHHHIDKESQHQVDTKISNIEANIEATVNAQLNASQELTKVRQHIASLEKEIEIAENDKKALSNRMHSLKAKLSVANVNLNTGNEEKESMRTNLNEAEIQVARLEERLSASTADLDRIRDPANPESNMNMKKHAVNDRKTKKSLKVENENEASMLDMDRDIVNVKDKDIANLEKELKDTRDMLDVCEKERDDEKVIGEEERAKREEMIGVLKELKAERKTYDQQLKDAKVKVGIAMSSQNVQVKVAAEISKRVKELQKQLKQTEKKVNDANKQLEVLKNQHKLTKTAQSINNYTQRNQLSKGIKTTSMVQTGAGPLKFTANSHETKVKSPSKASSVPDRSKPTANGSIKRPQREIKSATTRKSDAGVKDQKQPLTGRSGNTGGGAVSKEKRNSVQLVPPPKVKLNQNNR